MRWKLEVFGALALAIGLWVLLARHPAFQAHRWNADGVQAYRQGKFEEARRLFEKALGAGLWTHVVQLNLGDAHVGGRHWALAHESYQKSLEVRGDYLPAVWNDGLALEAWGRAEIDSNYCRIDRTLELWALGIERFASLTGSPDYGAEAAGNIDAISNNIRALMALHASNADKCGGGGGASQTSPGGAPSRAPTQGSPTAGTGKPPPSSPKPDPIDDDGNPIPPPAPGPGQLTGGEEAALAEARARITRDGRQVTFRQTSAQQLRRGTNRVNVGAGLYK